MKKFLAICLVCASAVTANAQNSYQGNRFFDNWSLGVEVGGTTKTTHNAFWDGMRPAYGLELKKQLNTVLGFSLQGLLYSNTTSSHTAIDQSNLMLLSNWNLTNIFCGYNGVPRVFELEAVVGGGWGHDFGHGVTENRNLNVATAKLGLNFNFNLGEEKAWTFSIKPSIVYYMDPEIPEPNNTFNVNNSKIEILAGLAYHFKSSNDKHYLTKYECDYSEIDALNAKINDLRGEMGAKDRAISDKDAEIKRLNDELNDCRNRKPEVQTINKSAETLESVVTFRQGKSVVDNSQLPNVERIATYMKNHKNSTVDIKGYASPEGSVEINERLAKARAEAVKTMLIKKYKIAESRITAEGQGVGNMFSEPDWNRVSISTINVEK